jgi:hypothetical protein
MMAFDPDAYLASIKAPSGGFNPDAYLAANKIPVPKPTTQELINQIPGGSAPQNASSDSSPGAGQTWYQKALGAVTAPLDVGAGMLQGAVMNTAGNLYGIGKEVATGNFGHGLAERTSAQFQQQHAYQPASPQGAAALQTVGSALNRSGVAGVAPDMSMFGALNTLGPDATSQFAQGAGREAGYLGEAVRTGAAKIGDMAPESVKSAGRAIAKPFHYLASPEASAGAQGARAMSGELAKEVPIPGAKPTTPEPPPMPRAPLTLPSNVHTPALSTIQINNDLSKVLEARNAALDNARIEAGNNIESTISQTPQSRLDESSPLYHSLGNFKNSLIKAQDNAGTGVQRAALQNVINDVEHIRSNSDTPLSSLIDLRRQLSQKANFGQPSSGFDAIGERASAGLSKQLNAILDNNISGYKEARAQYGDVLGETTPFRSRLLKSLGADETTGADLSARVMQSPQNVKLAIEAAGDVKPVDAAIAQRVQTDMRGKNVAAMRDYVDEHRPILDMLPQAAKKANDVLSNAEASQALQDIQKASEARFKSETALRDKALNQQADEYNAGMNKYTKSHELAAKYQGEVVGLNKLPPYKLPSALRTVLKNMYDDKIIGVQKYSDALDKVKTFEASINRQKMIRRFTGAATAVGFAQYALHRKMWDIIVGATR